MVHEFLLHFRADALHYLFNVWPAEVRVLLVELLDLRFAFGFAAKLVVAVDDEQVVDGRLGGVEQNLATELDAFFVLALQ